MKIIDKNKDYYDYLSTIYGVDDRLVYVRNEPQIQLPKSVIPENLFSALSQINRRAVNGWDEFNGGYLLIVDTLYYVQCQASIFEPLVIGRGGTKMTMLNQEEMPQPPKLFHWYLDRKPIPAVIHDPDMKIAMNLKRPVAFIRYYKNSGILVDTPNIAQIGNAANRIDAEQTYQKIELFLGLMKDSMIEPPTPNDVKIRQAGFDTKTSFRHRVSDR